MKHFIWIASQGVKLIVTSYSIMTMSKNLYGK